MTRFMPARLAAAAFLALATGCGPSISSTKSPTLVPGTGTYAWGGALAVGEAGQGYTIVNQNLRLRILAAIDSGMTGKGYRKVDSSSAQFLARYAVGVKTTSTDVPVVDAGPDAPVPMTRCNSGGCWNGWDYGYNTAGDPAFAGITEREAGVVLELLDQKTGALAWQGVYRDEATGKAPTPERIKKAIAQLLKTLPAMH
jgi:hypothetical protein